MWKTTSELLEDIYKTREELRKTRDVEMAHAECRLYVAAIKVLDVALEHGRLTNNLAPDGIVPVKLTQPEAKVKALKSAK